MVPYNTYLPIERCETTNNHLAQIRLTIIISRKKTHNGAFPKKKFILVRYYHSIGMETGERCLLLLLFLSAVVSSGVSSRVSALWKKIRRVRRHTHTHTHTTPFRLIGVGNALRRVRALLRCWWCFSGGKREREREGQEEGGAAPTAVFDFFSYTIFFQLCTMAFSLTHSISLILFCLQYKWIIYTSATRKNDCWCYTKLCYEKKNGNGHITNK